MAEPLGQMVIELGLDSSAFGKGLTGAKQQVKYAMAEMKSGLSVMSQSGKAVDTLMTKQRGLSNVISAQESVVSKLKKSYDDSFVNGKATAATGRLATQLQNATAKLNGFRNQLANNASALAQAKVQTEGWTGSLNRVSTAATNAGTRMSSMGSTLTKRVTAPIVLGLGAAAKAAIDFDSQISAMGPLLTNGGAVTAKFRAQLDELGKSSKSWSTQYGISTTEINNAMSEMIKRGFTTKQVMGSMPAVLDASKASGEDLGTVMQATASIVEQFGLKTSSVQGTMKNTQRVTDALTYSSNATAAGFGDMSEAMSYVGPVAKGLGLSVEETAAAIGILSNRGIEGEKAGTNLRGMLTSLVKPTKQNTAGFTAMGISAEQLKKDSSDLPQLIRDITKGTEGWSKADRSKAIAQAFGRENQAAVNALVESGADSLDKLTTATENSTGATKKQAEQLNDTKANQIKRFQSAVQVLGITFGEELLPSLTPIVKEATQVVKAFADMDEGTRKFIVHAGLVAAAAGPVLKVTGELSKGFGFVGGGVVNLIAKYAGFKAKSDVLNASMNTTESATKSVNNTLANVNGTVNTAKTSYRLLGSTFLATGSQAGVLGTALSPLGAAIIGSTVAIGAGVAIWELWGKQAAQSAHETDTWGSKVGSAADKSLTKMSNFVTSTDTQLQTFNTSSTNSAKTLSKEFKSAFKQMEKDSKDSIDKMQKEVDKLPDSVKGSGQKSLDKKKESNQKLLDEDEKLTTNVNAIFKRADKEHRGLTDDENTYIKNAQQKLSDDEISLLNISSSKKKAIQQALNGDISKMNRTQRDDAIDGLTKLITKEDSAYKTQQKNLKDSYDDGLITEKQYNTQSKALKTQHKATMMAYLGDEVKLWKANGMSIDDINSALQTYGVTYSQVTAANDKAAQKAAKSNSTLVKTTSDMSKGIKKAANDWNETIFDPKTGKVKTNAVEEIAKAKQGSQTWNNINLLLKEGKMSVKGKELVAQAVQQGNTWNSLSLKNQVAIAKVTGDDSVISALDKFGLWNKLTPQQKTAVSKAKGSEEVFAAIGGIDRWNSSNPQEKLAMLHATGNNEIDSALNKISNWNNVPVKVQNLIANDLASGKTTDALNLINQYGGTNAVANLFASDNTGPNVSGAKNNVASFTTMPSTKTLFANDSTGGGVNSGKGQVNGFTSMPGTKKIDANDSTGGGVNSGKGQVNSFTNMNGTKPLTANDNTGGGVGSAKNNINSVHGKTVTITGLFKAVKTGAVSLWNKLGLKNGTDDFQGGMALVNDQLGRKFREVIQLPTGESFIPQGRNVTIPLPQHARVIPANKTARMFPGLPQFAKGLNVPSDADIVRQPKQIVQEVQTNSNVTDNSSVITGLVSQVKSLTDNLNSLISVIQNQNSKEVAVILDNGVMARGVAPLITKIQENDVKRQTRLRGGRQ